MTMTPIGSARQVHGFLFACNACPEQTCMHAEKVPERWMALGRDVHLCPACGSQRLGIEGLLDKVLALPTELLAVVLQVVEGATIAKDEAEKLAFIKGWLTSAAARLPFVTQTERQVDAHTRGWLAVTGDTPP